MTKEKTFREKSFKEKLSHDVSASAKKIINEKTAPVRGKAKATKEAVGKWTDKNTPTLKKGVKGTGRLVGKSARGAGRLAKLAGTGIAAAGGAALGAAKSSSSRSTQSESDTTTAWFLFGLSILLYLSDIFMTRFNGIDIKYFIGLDLVDWMIKAGILTVFIIAFLFEVLLGSAKTKEEKIWAAVFSAVYAFIFVATSYSGGAALHLGFASLMWFLLIKKSNQIVNGYKTITILIILDFILFTSLESLFAFSGLTSSLWLANRLIFPIYSLYLLSYLKKYGSKFAGLLLFLLLTSYVTASITTSPQFQTWSDSLDDEKIAEGEEFRRSSLDNLREFIGIMTDPLACMNIVNSDDHDQCLKERRYERECRGEKGEEYELCIKSKKTGEIQGVKDESVTEITKVEFEKKEQFPEQVQKEFPPPISIQLNIESPKKPIDIYLSCQFEKSQENTTGIIVSNNPLKEIQGKQKETVLCDLPEGEEYETGKYKVTFTAEVRGIETTSRLTRLFVVKDITEQRKNELLTLHSLNQIEPSKSPDEFAVFSFGMGTPSTTPFLYDNEQQPIIGNIENKEEGRIVSIESIRMEFPEGTVPTNNCFETFNSDGNELISKSETVNILKLDKLKKGDKLYFLGCYLEIPPALMPDGYENEYFKREFESHILYTYQIKEHGTFEVISNEV